jgi:hypothetical protein
MISKVSTGWPPPTPVRIERIGRPEKNDMYNLGQILNSDRFQTTIYSWFNELRDIDFELLRRFVNWDLPSDEQIRSDDFPVTITQLAIDSPKLVT